MNIHTHPASVGGHIPSAAERRPPLWLTLTGILIGLGLLTGFLRAPIESIFAVSIGFSAVCTLYSCFRLAAILLPAPSPSPLIDAGAAVPTFSVLLPLYKEQHMIKTLTESIERLDYPRERLDVIIICEPDDIGTIDAAQSHTSEVIRVFVTSGRGPRTKPNALNAALPTARGDIITVYDAEDRPDPAQLRAAAAALDANPRLAVAQAPLTYYNASQNWLTRQFTLEYDALFQVWIPFLARLGLPFPLGGTSNHIRRTALIQVGGWDAYNVTEDADLSFRFAAFGWELGYITPPTHEEAVSEWRQWQGQRSRWMKGYMQTWLTHMKHPLTPGGMQGWARQVTLQITLGAALIAGLCHVPSIFLLATVLIYGAVTNQPISPPLHFMAALGFSYSAGILIGVVGAARTGRKGLTLSALAMPFYWALLFAPTIQAVWELVLRPFHWNKTEHGDKAHAAKSIDT